MANRELLQLKYPLTELAPPESQAIGLPREEEKASKGFKLKNGLQPFLQEREAEAQLVGSTPTSGGLDRMQAGLGKAAKGILDKQCAENCSPRLASALPLQVKRHLAFPFPNSKTFFHSCVPPSTKASLHPGSQMGEPSSKAPHSTYHISLCPPIAWTFSGAHTPCTSLPVLTLQHRKERLKDLSRGDLCHSHTQTECTATVWV